MEVIIKRADDLTTGIDDFINKEFSDYARENEVALNYEDFTFAAWNESNEIIGVITGRAYYNEVHIGDLCNPYYMKQLFLHFHHSWHIDIHRLNRCFLSHG